MLLWWAQPAIQILSGIYCTLSLWPLLAIWQTKKRKKSISTWLNFFMCLGFQLRGHSITTWTRWGGEGVKNVWFCPRSGYENCPRRGGVKKWQNSDHVVVECPHELCFCLKAAKKYEKCSTSRLQETFHITFFFKFCLEETFFLLASKVWSLLCVCVTLHLYDHKQVAAFRDWSFNIVSNNQFV